MGQAYAGVLGCVAFFAEMARGVLHGSGAETTIPTALIGMFGFAALGYLCGVIAEEILRDAVQAQLAMEVAGQNAKQAATAAGPTTVAT